MCAIYTVPGNAFVFWMYEFHLTHSYWSSVDRNEESMLIHANDSRKGHFLLLLLLAQFSIEKEKSCATQINQLVQKYKRETTRIKLNMWQVKHWSIHLWFSFYFAGFDNEWAARCTRAHVQKQRSLFHCFLCSSLSWFVSISVMMMFHWLFSYGNKCKCLQWAYHLVWTRHQCSIEYNSAFGIFFSTTKTAATANQIQSKR